MNVDTNQDPGTPTSDLGAQKEILRGILQKFIDTHSTVSVPSQEPVQVDYKEMVQLLHPVAMEYRKRVGLVDEPTEGVSPTRNASRPEGVSPAVSMIISLDDELEWQESSRTHSPRTPSAPEALRNLKRGSPPQTPPLPVISPDVGTESREGGSLAGVTALKLLSKEGVISGSTIRGDHLYLPDGTILPLALSLPLKVRVVTRKDESGHSESSISDEPVHLLAGSAWLSILAERTYESSLASLLRARRGLQEISIEDRIVLNRFLKGSIPLRTLQASRLWVGPVDDSEMDPGRIENTEDMSDVLSEKLRIQNQRISLEEKKRLLKEQQLRLRRLLARELQRIHSAKPAAVSTLISRTVSTDDVVVQEPVSTTAKRVIESIADNGPTIVTPTVQTRVVRNRENSFIHQKLKELEIEWYRIGDRIRRAIEDEDALERRIKRLRYVV